MMRLVALEAGALALLAACGDSTAPPKPSALSLVGQPPSSIEVGSAISITVAVKDQNGNAMSGQPLSVVVTGGGTVSGVPTSSQGQTTLGGWTLGTRVGANTMTVTSGSLTPLTISVQGTAGPPSGFSVSSIPTSGVVGQTIAVPLTAVDAYGNATSAVTVAISATGGGAASPSTATSDASGAVLALWTLANTVGTNTLRVESGAASRIFSITSIPDVPASIQVVTGDNQSGAAGSVLALSPIVKVSDRFGNANTQQTVNFTVAAGGGLLASGTASTDASGVVTAPAWTLGKRNIAQQLGVNTGNALRLISANILTSYKITLRYIGSPTDAQRAVFEGAAARVSAAITQGAAPAAAVNFPLATSCGLTGFAPLTEVIDGIVIYAGIGPIDGAHNILAESGPCAFRVAAGGFLPAIAIMEFDEADLATLANGGSLEDVATHEMFHAIGYGTLWSTYGLVSGSAVDPRYAGLFGTIACLQVALSPVCGSAVPLENTGGAGTAGAHWRETVFGHELMTGYLNSGTNPLSVMSIQAMRDLGYSVSPTAADPYSQATGVRGTQSPVPLNPTWEKLFGAAPSDLELSGGLLTRKRTP
jgi:hypothetical protein